MDLVSVDLFPLACSLSSSWFSVSEVGSLRPLWLEVFVLLGPWSVFAFGELETPGSLPGLFAG